MKEILQLEMCIIFLMLSTNCNVIHFLLFTWVLFVQASKRGLVFCTINCIINLRHIYGNIEYWKILLFTWGTWNIFICTCSYLHIVCVCFCLLDCFVSWYFNCLEVDITRILVLLSYFKKWLFIRKSDHDLILLSFLQ